MRTRKGRKKPLLTSGTAAFARRFCSGVHSLPRIGGESSPQSSHRGYLLPGWQTAAFASAIPNALGSKTSLALKASFFIRRGRGRPLKHRRRLCFDAANDGILANPRFKFVFGLAAYGDDPQAAAANYPLVRITNNRTGHVSYSRTHDHTSRLLHLTLSALLISMCRQHKSGPNETR